MEELDLREYLQVIRRRLWIIVLVTVLAAATSGVLSYFVIEPTYESSTTLMVLKKEAPVADYNTMLLNRSLVRTYGEIAKSRTVAEKVIGSLDLDLTAEEFQKRIKVTPVRDTEIIQISAEDSDPKQAARIANEVASAFIGQVRSIMKVENVEVVDPAKEPVRSKGPRPKRNIAMAGILGLMTAFGLVFLIEFMDNTIKTQNDVTRYLGLPVIGAVPLIKGKARTSKGPQGHQLAQAETSD